jgi:hypothetical protein
MHASIVNTMPKPIANLLPIRIFDKPIMMSTLLEGDSKNLHDISPWKHNSVITNRWASFPMSAAYNAAHERSMITGASLPGCRSERRRRMVNGLAAKC